MARSSSRADAWLRARSRSRRGCRTMPDAHARPCLAIIGMGAVSAAGLGVAALAELLNCGGSALRPRSRAALGQLDPGWVGEIPDAEAEPEQAGSMAILPNPVAQALC